MIGNNEETTPLIPEARDEKPQLMEPGERPPLLEGMSGMVDKVQQGVSDAANMALFGEVPKANGYDSHVGEVIPFNGRKKNVPTPAISIPRNPDVDEFDLAA